MNIRLLFFVYFVLAAGLASAQSSLRPANTLEWRFVVRPTVSEEPGDGFCSLRIRGLSGASAMVVEQTTVKRIGRSAHVNIGLALAHDQASGNFDVAVLLDSAIDQVLFGDNNTSLWRRENSKCSKQ